MKATPRFRRSVLDTSNTENARAVLLAGLIALVMNLATDSRIGAQPATGWGAPATISEIELSAALPSLAVDGQGVVHAIWTGSAPEDDQERGAEYVIYYSRYVGGVWTEPRDVILGPGLRVDYPSMAADRHGILHVMWLSDHKIYYSSAPAIMAESARAWSAPTQLDVDSAVPQFPVQVQVDQHGILHAVASDNVQTLYYFRSADGGATWARFLAEEAGMEHQLSEPQLTVDAADRLHLVWSVFEVGGWPPDGVMYAWSEDGGKVWSDPTRLSPAGLFAKPSIIEREPNELHVVWSGTGEAGGRYHAWSLDGGQTWFPMARINGFPYTLGGTLQGLAVDAANGLHLVAGIEEVRASDWQGQSWSEPVEISPVPPLGLRQECEALSAHVVLGNRLLAAYNCVRSEGQPDPSSAVWVNWRTLNSPTIEPQSPIQASMTATPGRDPDITTNTDPSESQANATESTSAGATPTGIYTDYGPVGTNPTYAAIAGILAAAVVVSWAIARRAMNE